jgi:hypothetical protein
MKKGVGSGDGSRSRAGSGSISQRNGSGDPDPDPHQNVTDPQHWLSGCSLLHEVSERVYFDVHYILTFLFLGLQVWMRDFL